MADEASEASSEKVIPEEIKPLVKFLGKFPEANNVGPEFTDREAYWRDISRDLRAAVRRKDLTWAQFDSLMGNLAAAKEWLSERDPLTKLGNRRAYDQVLSARMAESARHGFSLSIIILDLNNFKAVNDTFGHPEGDRFLIKIANILRSEVRPEDFIARIGGDEIAIILPYATEQNGQFVITRLQKSVNGYVNANERYLELAKNGTPLGASFGVAQWDGAESKEALFERADDKLGINKRLSKIQPLEKNG